MSNEWQPIETAPKDGTWILLYKEQELSGIVQVDEWCPSIQTVKWAYDRWCECSGYSAFATPTHWMPLPKPPTETK